MDFHGILCEASMIDIKTGITLMACHVVTQVIITDFIMIPDAHKDDDATCRCVNRYSSVRHWQRCSH